MGQKNEAFRLLADRLAARGQDVDQVVEALAAQRVEVPSWGFADSGTRFQVFHHPGAAKTTEQKLADAAQVHRFTGICPSVALHIPWDKVEDYGALSAYAARLGLTLGAINPNLFQEAPYRLGSLCHPDAAVRQQAVDHVLECIQIARATGSRAISLWLADGTNYPGQDSLVGRKHRLQEALAQVYRALDPGMRLLIEYKFFEPAFYSTDIPDWGLAYLLATRLGPQAQVLVDLGHHPLGTNIEQIVGVLLDEGKLGGFHFNAKKYADDDLIVGSTNPYELFLIFHELISAGPRAADVAYMIDQSHNVEGKIAAMILSVMNVQTAYAKALLIDRTALQRAQEAGDVLGGHAILQEAFETDVRPLLAVARERLGVPADPLAAYLASGYEQRIAAERG
ncbi:MAG: L-rhamnose isomerase [Anaerolineae bacterium]